MEKKRKLKKQAKCLIVILFLLIIFTIYYFFLRISPVSYTSELGESIQVSGSDFLKNCQDSKAQLQTDLSTIDTSKVGKHQVFIEYKNKTYESYIEIKDTIAPTATIIDDLSCYIGNPIEASSCVKDIQDYSNVSVSFDKDYQFDQEKEYKIGIVLADEWNNETHYSTVVHVKKDDQAPRIDQNTTLYVKKNEKDVDYTKGLKITDNVSSEEAIQVNTDDSKVDLSKVGQYNVLFELKDEVGNVSNEKRKVIVYTLEKGSLMFGKYDASLDASVKKLLDEIITDNMDDKQKLEAFYKWCIKNLKYKNNGEKEYKKDINGNLPIYAKDILTKRTGHCFHYAALEVYVMNKLDIPVVLVEGGGHNVHGNFELHYWTMVQLDGKWYHFDPLFEQLYKYTRQFFLVSSSSIYNSSHNWDKSKYPWS